MAKNTCLHLVRQYGINSKWLILMGIYTYLSLTQCSWLTFIKTWIDYATFPENKRRQIFFNSMTENETLKKYCTQRLMCIHTIVLNRLIQIIYNKCGFLQRVSFEIYFILFIQGRTRFKMNIIMYLWCKFLDILKSYCKNGST